MDTHGMYSSPGDKSIAVAARGSSNIYIWLIQQLLKK
jgi:hypothetical protein